MGRGLREDNRGDVGWKCGKEGWRWRGWRGGVGWEEGSIIRSRRRSGGREGILGLLLGFGRRRWRLGWRDGVRREKGLVEDASVAVVMGGGQQVWGEGQKEDEEKESGGHF